MDDSSWFAQILLASPGQERGPVISAVTAVDVLVVLLAVGAAARGWQLGLTRFELGVAGLLSGVLAGLWGAAHLVPGGLSAGVAMASGVGFVLAAGAIARGALALVLCWLLAAGAAAFAPPPTSTTAAVVTSRSIVLSAVGDLTRSISGWGQQLDAQVPLAGSLVATNAHVPARLPLRLSAPVQPGASVPVLSASPEYRSAADVRPGNSGGPLLDAGAPVIARSLDEPGVGYAIASTRIAPVLADALTTTTPVATGTCTAA